MGLLELTGFDKVIKAFRIIKQIGGVRAAIRKRYFFYIFRNPEFNASKQRDVDVAADLSFHIAVGGSKPPGGKPAGEMDETRVGTLVGEDKFGNKYYEDNEYYMPRNRWVEYPVHQWLEYDATQIPPEWHRWLHHITDEPPSKNPPNNPKWVLDHEENLSIFEDKKFIPYSTTRPKVTGWQPGMKAEKP